MHAYMHLDVDVDVAIWRFSNRKDVTYVALGHSEDDILPGIGENVTLPER